MQIELSGPDLTAGITDISDGATIVGHAGNLVHGRAGSLEVLAMQGRVHFYEGFAAWQVAPWADQLLAYAGNPLGSTSDSMTATLEAFADTLIPGAKRYDDINVARHARLGVIVHGH